MKTKYLYITIAILAISLWGALTLQKQTAQERDRMESNQRSLLSDVTYYKTKDSLSAASVERLELSKQEMTKYQASLVAQIEDLGVKIKRLQSASSTATETKVEIKTVIRDSIIYRDGGIDTVPCISFNDPWISFEGCLFGQTFNGLILSRDTLIQVVHRVPYQWLCLKWGTKAIRQEIMSKNPHTQITYSEYIELKK